MMRYKTGRFSTTYLINYFKLLIISRALRHSVL